jgi:Generalcontrol nonderepressible 1 (Gcn1) N-terminal
LQTIFLSAQVASDFFVAYPHPLGIDVFRRLLVPILSCAKSANTEIRANSISLFDIIIERATSESKEIAVVELLKLAQAAKAIGPDRKILYAMFASLGASAQVSSVMVKSVPVLLAKETNETNLPTLASSLTPHLAFYLQGDLSFPDEVSKLLLKEMQNSKPSIRRAFVTLIGEIFWTLGDLKTANAAIFARAVFPAFESSLKSLSANPLNAAAGPLEGYVAIGVLLGPFARSGVFGSS